jgi:hypothetical protein
MTEIELIMCLVLWRVYPLLGNDREISKYTTAITKYRLSKQACFRRNSWIQQQRNCVFCAIRAEMISRTVSEVS